MVQRRSSPREYIDRSLRRRRLHPLCTRGSYRLVPHALHTGFFKDPDPKAEPWAHRSRFLVPSCGIAGIFYADVYSKEILNLKYGIDDGRFEYSSKVEEQISVQTLPARGLNSRSLI